MGKDKISVGSIVSISLYIQKDRLNFKNTLDNKKNSNSNDNLHSGENHMKSIDRQNSSIFSSDISISSGHNARDKKLTDYSHVIKV